MLPGLALHVERATQIPTMRPSMHHILAVFSFATLRVTAAILPTSSVPTASTTWPSAPAITSFGSGRGYRNEIRQPHSKNPNPGNFCGFSYPYTWSCIETLQSCTNSLFPNGNAYLYCSQVGAGSQVVYTTGYNYFGGPQSCVPDALCCASTAPFVENVFFTLSGYTVTCIACGNSSTPITFNADFNLLQPASFSAALASLHGHITTTSPTTSSTTTPAKMTSQSAHPTHTGHGMPLGEKIGIGVGVGVGVLGLILALLGFFLVRPLLVRRRARPALPEIDPPPPKY